MDGDAFGSAERVCDRFSRHRRRIRAQAACNTQDKAIAVKLLIHQRGAIAQLGERIVRNDEVVGSIPTSSTIFPITYRAPLTRTCSIVFQKFKLAAVFASTNLAFASQ